MIGLNSVWWWEKGLVVGWEMYIWGILKFEMGYGVSCWVLFYMV